MRSTDFFLCITGDILYFSDMKFTCEITISRPRSEVANAFKNPENLDKWQEGFLRKEPLSGEPEQAGSTANIYFKFGKGEMELTETILSNKLPDSFSGEYVHKHMTNTMLSTFIEISPTETLYKAEVEYTKFVGFMPKLMATLFPGMFKKQVQKWLNNMKIFLENESE